MDLASTVGVTAEDLPALDTMVLGEAVCGMVAQTRTPMACSDAHHRDHTALDRARVTSRP